MGIGYMLHVVQQVTWYFRARYFQAAATPGNGPLTQREFTDVSGVDRVKEAWHVLLGSNVHEEINRR